MFSCSRRLNLILSILGESFIIIYNSHNVYIYIYLRFIFSWITVPRVKLEHPVQFPSRLIVPSPARLSVTPWASEKRATDSRKEALSPRERRRRRRRRRRWKKQQGRERWRREGGSGKRGRKEARKCGGVDSTVLRGFRAAAGLPRARPNFYQKRALLFPFARIVQERSLGFFSEILFRTSALAFTLGNF